MTTTLLSGPSQTFSEPIIDRPAGPSGSSLITRFLDSLLSQELYQSSSSELARCRVLAGACCFALLFSVVALVAFPWSEVSIALALLILGYGVTLLLLRRATSRMLPATVLCATMTLGCVITVFIMKGAPYVGTNGAFTLVPLLAVYLVGVRRGFFITLLVCLSTGLIYPLYYTRFQASPLFTPDPLFWPFYATSTCAFLGAWALSALHSTSRDEAGESIERTLLGLRESESKLSSLFESTNDLMASLDAEGRLLTANSAAKRAYRVRFGHDLEAGQPFFPESAHELRASWMPRLALALAGQRQRVEEIYEHKGVRFTFDTSVNPIHGVDGRITGLTIFARNITARKNAELRLGEMHRTLVDVSRQAGMAEIATGVLHNVGNTLNSVNVSTSLVIDQLRKSRLSGFDKANALLREHATDLSAFLAQDPQGKKLPGYLTALCGQLHAEQEAMLKEMRSLSDSVEHIKSIVSMQQKHARSTGALEDVPVPLLIDEALRLHAISFERLSIQIERDYADVPPLHIDRHQLLQILVNLLSNARDALTATEIQGKRLIISVHPVPAGRHLRIQVTDNGIGIAAEHMPRMFSQGFTTKRDGHGFGLHISALAAVAMKGRLTCSSPGPGQGATFTLEVPMAEASA